MNKLAHPSFVVNPAFVPLFECKDRYLLVWGGRGSSKSVSMATKMVYRCLTESYFKCIMIRKVKDTVKDSIYEEIKQQIIRLGLEEFFQFKTSPLEIMCKLNGNVFLARGLDEPDKIKSIKDPTCAIYEEANQIDLQDFMVVTTSIRTTRADYLQEILLFNPETRGNYEEFWLYKMFFEGYEEKGKSFRGTINIELDDRTIESSYTVHHSTYKDNQFLDEQFFAFLENLKKAQPYYYTVWALGYWGNKTVEGRAYKDFTLANAKKKPYNQELPLHITFDFNTAPYMTLLVFQGFGKDLWQIDEICPSTPHNNTHATCKKLAAKYADHKTSVFVYGDPAGKAKSTKLEEGKNDYTIIEDALKEYKPRLRIASRAPNVQKRIEFINALFRGEIQDCSFTLHSDCPKTIADYQNVVEDADGTKLKKVVTDKESGLRFERYGHTSDAGDYLVCEYFKQEYEDYQKRSKGQAHSPNRQVSTKVY
jgi:PBSX family phage terminase large subunit